MKKIIWIFLFFISYSCAAKSFETVCIQKEIDDDNVIAQVRNDNVLLKKWSLKFSPLIFEGKCFPAKISSLFVEIILEDGSSIKWSIEEIISTSAHRGSQRGSKSFSQSECYESMVTDPNPFLGNGGELIRLSDGTLWRDSSYKYLYLYLYNPRVIICPSTGKMIVESNIFNVTRVK